MSNSMTDTEIIRKISRWQPPPILSCFLHVNHAGVIQHAEGDLKDLFGLQNLQNIELAPQLKWSGVPPPDLADWLAQSHTQKMALRTQLQSRPGEFTPVELQATYQGNGVYLIGIRSTFTEIVHQFTAQEVGILELLARGRPQSEILTRLILLIEDVLPGTTGSILLLNPQTQTFQQGVAPSLPEQYNQLLEGVKIGPKVGSCGSALYHGRRTVVKDISTDPLWADYRQLVLPLGFQACWSTPFFSEAGTTLGTFGIYYREQRTPLPYEMAILDAASHLAAVVISHFLNQRRLEDTMTALKQSEDRLDLALRGTGLGIWDWNLKTGQVILGDRWLSMLGYAANELPHAFSTWEELLHPDDAARAKQALAEHHEGKTSLYDVQFRLRTKDGSWRWVQAWGRVMEFTADGQPLRMTGTHQDIHERRCAQERVQENQRVLETLLSNLVGMAYRCRIDEHWTMEFISQGCVQLTGYQSEEIVGNKHISYEEITHPEDRKRVRDEVYESLELGRQFDLNYRIIKADGTVRTVWERGIGIRSADGNLEFLEGFITDITDNQGAQAKIAEQAALLDRAQDAIIVRDLQGIVTYWNQGATRLYGWTSEEASGRPVLDLFYREGTAYLNAMKVLLKAGEWSGELLQFNRANREITVESRWTLLRDEKGNPKSILTINTDVTEKKRIEAQFLRAQRMESIGTLAGGIAHDLNNVLAPIIMSIDLLRLSVNDKQDIELLDQMNASAHHGASLVQQVLSFARGVEGRRVSINPSYLIKDVLKIMKDTFPKSITIKSHRSADLGMISGDPTQLHQVLLNLSVNARDAMPQGGTLTLRAENVKIDEAMAANMENATPGNFVCLIVEDTGTGISTEVQEKIFEPFFTTKEIGKGTGLGLSTVLAIVRSHGGFISIESALEKGTKFMVYLRTSNQPAEPLTSQVPTSIPREQGECILIVDDEPSVRSVLKNTLKAYGYEVLTAENGMAAIAVYKKEGNRIRAIVTDMMMPVMDGPTMITTLSQLNAPQPIIASSGLNESINIAKATAAGVDHFLAKPYTAETILRAVHEVIEQAATIRPPQTAGTE